MTTTNSELLTRDIKLLALSQRLKDARVEAVRLGDRTARLKGTPEFGRASDADEAAWKRYGEIEDQIAAIPATTIAGIVIKLRVVAMSAPTQGPLDVYETNIKSALADAERLAGRAI